MAMISPLDALPDELLEAIIYHMPPAATLAFGSACKRTNKITYEPMVWRRHCMQTWRYWDPHHNIKQKLALPPAQTKWRLLFTERQRTDKRALRIFDELVAEQQHRMQRLEQLARLGYDAKDLLVRLRHETPDDAEDVLARRYHADATLGQIHRTTALDKWGRLQRRQMVRMEEILGAYDLFVLAGREGDLNDLDAELDRLADGIKLRDPDFDDLSVRKKAVQIAKFLRSENLLGNNSEEDYHALRNNFISIALFDEPHTSLPLQSVAIYCAVARRLGINAKPSNYPHHVHAVIEAPADQTLNGKPKAPPAEGEDPEIMHMDPWRSSDEVPRDQLTLRLSQMGAPPSQHAYHLGATTTLETALRTGRNIMNSVQEARNRFRSTPEPPTYPDIESAWYAMLWSMLVLGDTNSANTAHRRRQCLPYLIEHYQAHYPEDLGLIETVIAPMFEGEREHAALMHLVTTGRTADANKRAPSFRSKLASDNDVEFHVGTHFRHKRYGYSGVIVGWDKKCGAEQHWIERMRVDDLTRGRQQPFYNVVADEKSARYVAEENIERVDTKPCDVIMGLAGRYFKRWDDETKMFVSNMRDEYPED